MKSVNLVLVAVFGLAVSGRALAFSYQGYNCTQVTAAGAPEGYNSGSLVQVSDAQTGQLEEQQYSCEPILCEVMDWSAPANIYDDIVSTGVSNCYLHNPPYCPTLVVDYFMNGVPYCAGPGFAVQCSFIQLPEGCGPSYTYTPYARSQM